MAPDSAILSLGSLLGASVLASLGFRYLRQWHRWWVRALVLTYACLLWILVTRLYGRALLAFVPACAAGGEGLPVYLAQAVVIAFALVSLGWLWPIPDEPLPFRWRASLGDAALGLTVAIALVWVRRPESVDTLCTSSVADTALGFRLALPTVLLEEVVLRGRLQHTLGAWLPSRYSAALGQALVGAVLHVPGRFRVYELTGIALPVAASLAWVFLVSVVLGLLRQRTQSLVAPLVMHWSLNALFLLAAINITR